MATSRQPTLSDKERLLIEAARREAAARKMASTKVPPAVASPITPPVAPNPSATTMGEKTGGKTIMTAASPAALGPPAARSAAPRAKGDPAEPAAPSMEHRIAALVAAEREEKARRAKIHQRWKIAGGGVLLALLLWWAVVVLSYMHH